MVFNKTEEQWKESGAYWTSREIYQQPETWLKTFEQIRKEKDAISVRIKAGKFPLGSQEFYVVYGEPVYGKNGKGSGTVTVNFKPECKYYSGTLKLTYKITKVPKK